MPRRAHAFLQRSDIVMDGVLVVLGVAFLAAMILMRNTPGGLLVLGALAAAHVIVRVILSRKVKSVTRAVHAADWRCCLNCVHDLRDLGERGRCPECGEPFILHETTIAWTNAGGGDPQPYED